MKRLVYLAQQFPVVTETFTINEVRSLREHGLRVDVRALRPPPADLPVELRPLLDDAVVAGPALGPRAGLGLLARAPVLAASVLSRQAPRRGLGLLRGLGLASGLRAGDDHVHAQFPLEAATAGLYAAAASGASYSFSGHTLHQLDLMRSKLERAAFVTVGSEFERDVLCSRYGEGYRTRIHVRRLGVPPRPSRTSAEPGLIVTAGTLSGKKGHDVLLRAFAQAQPGARLELVGEGPHRTALEELARDLGVESRVRFRGALGYSETLATIGRASVFALCCRLTPDGDHDCLPVALMDAMSVGVPVVSSRAFGIPDLIEDGHSGLLAPPDDPSASAEALSRLLSDDALATRISLAGRDVVRERFDLERNTRALTELFASYLA
jgi:colanic acid/amylovoran biosynthesis glycosyltransferase